MRRREQLLIDGPVSPAVLGRLEKIMSVMVSLFPGEREPVRVEATAAAEPPRGADLNACFFSGGVDSWDTVLTLLEEHPNGVRPPTHLIFSPDFKPASFTEQQLEQKVAAAQASADALGLGFIALETNLKRTIKGPILVAAGLALGSTGIWSPPA
jgi:hypothetical protein